MPKLPQSAFFFHADVDSSEQNGRYRKFGTLNLEQELHI